MEECTFSCGPDVRSDGEVVMVTVGLVVTATSRVVMVFGKVEKTAFVDVVLGTEFTGATEVTGVAEVTVEMGVTEEEVESRGVLVLPTRPVR